MHRPYTKWGDFYPNKIKALESIGGKLGAIDFVIKFTSSAEFYYDCKKGCVFTNRCSNFFPTIFRLFRYAQSLHHTVGISTCMSAEVDSVRASSISFWGGLIDMSSSVESIIPPKTQVLGRGYEFHAA